MEVSGVLRAVFKNWVGRKKLDPDESDFSSEFWMNSIDFF
jgi:hypothetical protein